MTMMEKLTSFSLVGHVTLRSSRQVFLNAFPIFKKNLLNAEPVFTKALELCFLAGCFFVFAIEFAPIRYFVSR